MKVLAILGSPRTNGNVARMLEETCNAARSAGHTVDSVNLYQCRIAFCTGCMRCRSAGVCPVDDELAAIREKLLACDIVILAAPTYFANVPAPVKNLFDRLSGAAMDEGRFGIPRGRFRREQRYLLLTACTTPAPFHRLCGQSRGTLRAMREFFHTGGMRPMGSIVFAGTKRAPGEAQSGKLPVSLQKRLRHMWQ